MPVHILSAEQVKNITKWVTSTGKVMYPAGVGKALEGLKDAVEQAVKDSEKKVQRHQEAEKARHEQYKAMQIANDLRRRELEGRPVQPARYSVFGRKVKRPDNNIA